jgi:type VI secretion system ImpM family protein
MGDFLRVNAAAPPAPALVEWIHRAHEAMHRSGAVLPAAPIRFVFSDRTAADSLVGVMVASRDRVGRAFPLTAFTSVPGAAVRSAGAGLHAAAEAFASSAEALLARAAELDGPALSSGLDALAPVDDAAGAAARLAGAAAGLSAAELLGGLFAGLPPGAPAYALYTLQKAVRSARGGITVDCPAPDARARWFWLELVRRTLDGSDLPAHFWLGGRLLVSLGAPQASALGYLGDPSHPSGDVWPLRTEVPNAIAQAWNAFPAAARRELEKGSVAALLESLAGRRGGAR